MKMSRGDSGVESSAIRRRRPNANREMAKWRRDGGASRNGWHKDIIATDIGQISACRPAGLRSPRLQVILSLENGHFGSESSLLSKEALQSAALQKCAAVYPSARTSTLRTARATAPRAAPQPKRENKNHIKNMIRRS